MDSLSRKDGFRYGIACYGVSLSSAVAAYQGYPPAAPWVGLVAAPLLAALGVFLRHRLYMNDPEALAEYRATFEANPLSKSLQSLGGIDKIIQILLKTGTTGGEGVCVATIREKLQEELGVTDPTLSRMVELYGGSLERSLKPFLKHNIVSQDELFGMLLSNILGANSLADLFDAFEKKGLFVGRSEPLPGKSVSSVLGLKQDTNMIALLSNLSTYIGTNLNNGDLPSAGGGGSTSEGRIVHALKALVALEFPWARSQHGIPPVSYGSGGSQNVLHSVVRFYALLRHPAISFYESKLTEIIESADRNRIPKFLVTSPTSPSEEEKNTIIYLQALAARNITSLDWRSNSLTREIVSLSENERNAVKLLASAFWYLETLTPPSSSAKTTGSSLPPTCTRGHLLTLLGYTIAKSNLRDWNFEDDSSVTSNTKKLGVSSGIGLKNTSQEDIISSLVVSFTDRAASSPKGARNAVRRPPTDIQSSVHDYYNGMESDLGAIGSRRRQGAGNQRGGATSDSATTTTMPLFTLKSIAPLFRAAFPTSAVSGNAQHGDYYNRGGPSSNRPSSASSLMTPMNSIVLFCIYWEPLLRAHGRDLIPYQLMTAVRDVMETFDEKVEKILDEYNDNNGLMTETGADDGGRKRIGDAGPVRMQAACGPLKQADSKGREARCKADIGNLLGDLQEQFERATSGYTYKREGSGNNNSNATTFSFNWNGQSVASAGCAQQ